MDFIILKLYVGLSAEEFKSSIAEIADVINDEMWQRIADLSNSKNSSDSLELEVTQMDKEKRTQIHKVIKKLYTGKLVSKTINLSEMEQSKIPAVAENVDSQERKFIKICTAKGGRGKLKY